MVVMQRSEIKFFIVLIRLGEKNIPQHKRWANLSFCCPTFLKILTDKSDELRKRI